MQIFKPESKLIANALAWLQKCTKAVDKYNTQLQCFIQDDGWVLATDRHRIHAVKAQPWDTGDVVRFPGTIKATPGLEELEFLNEDYPDLKALIPTSEPLVRVSFQSHHLKDMVDKLPKGTPVVMVIREGNEPIEFIIESDPKRYGLINQYHDNRDDAAEERPY